MQREALTWGALTPKNSGVDAAADIKGSSMFHDKDGLISIETREI